MTEVASSEKFADKARDLDDEQLRKAAKLLLLDDLADSGDIGQFLAIAREAAERTTALRPFDVQLLGALRMLAGDVVEMATGEGKTLSGAIAAAGYALAGRHVHVVTINDYLARRDAEWMGPLIEAMGLTGRVDHRRLHRRGAPGGLRMRRHLRLGQRIGFDVLRDQLVTDVADLVSPNPDVALIDEADSVLVDEALVPLVLAGTTHRETPKLEIVRLVGDLVPGQDFDTDSDSRNVHLTETGAQKIERALGGIDLYAEEHVGTTLTEVNVALHAHVLLQRDVHYIVRDGAVQLINSSRGRIAALQRWPDGLQAAVEAKEGIETTETGEVLDTITVQALINRYPTVCGMTGTALAAGEQLRQFYKLGVSPIPPNTPNVREDEADRVYITAAAKNDAIIDHIIEVHATGQPILVGTPDVAESEAARGCCGAGCRRWCSTPRTTRRRPGHRGGGQARRGDGLHPDGRAGHRYPARRLRRRRPVRRPPEVAELGGLRRRHRAAPHRAAGQPAARPRRRQGDPSGRRCSSPAGRTMWWPLTSIPASCRPNATRPAGSPAPRRRRCWTTPSGWPRPAARRAPTPGATTS